MKEPGEDHHATDDGGTHHGGAGRLPPGTGSSAELWDGMYRSRPRVWSGLPNPQLVAEAAGLPAGTALDLGCGEGADALWLAQHGWTVTAVDVSAVALERAAAHGAETLDAGRISWVHADLANWTADETFDLVSAQFLHSTVLSWQDALRNTPSAVRPGGTLLIVGHHPDGLPPWGGHHSPGMFFTAEQLVRELGLDAAGWRLDVVTKRDRKITGPDGVEVTVSDAVLRAIRTFD